jgi:branched-chain amino acid transport system permease protein
MIPIINFHWKDLSNQLDPSKYQRLVFGIILILMMIYRPAGILPAARRKRELKADSEDAAAEDATAEGPKGADRD